MSWSQVASNPQGLTALSQPNPSDVSGLTNPANQALHNKNYDEMESHLNAKITTLTEQLQMLVANGEKMQMLMALLSHLPGGPQGQSQTAAFAHHPQAALVWPIHQPLLISRVQG